MIPFQERMYPRGFATARKHGKELFKFELVAPELSESAERCTPPVYISESTRLVFCGVQLPLQELPKKLKSLSRHPHGWTILVSGVGAKRNFYNGIWCRLSPGCEKNNEIKLFVTHLEITPYPSFF